jgi:hypothetical protein
LWTIKKARGNLEKKTFCNLISTTQLFLGLILLFTPIKVFFLSPHCGTETNNLCMVSIERQEIWQMWNIIALAPQKNAY